MKKKREAKIKDTSLSLKISLLLGIALLNSIANATEPLGISNAWVPAAPPVARVMAGYMTLKNNTNKTITLTLISSPDFKKVEIHRTETKGGMARMQKQTSVNVPAMGQIEFEPGGLHLMLIKPKRSIKLGEYVTLKLTANKKIITFKAMVKEASIDAHANHH